MTPALPPGIYTANVGFTVATFGEYYVMVSLAVSNPSPTLLLKEGVDGAEFDASWSASNDSEVQELPLESYGCRW